MDSSEPAGHEHGHKGSSPRSERNKSGHSGGHKNNHKRLKSHSRRGGANRRHHRNSSPQSSRYREDRQQKLQKGPAIPADLDTQDLDPSIRQDLRVLSKANADNVAKHLIMAASLLEEDPNLALEHARAAKERGGRVAITRETAGIAAYHAGEWREALSELRAARRISGGPGLLAVMADCERGLGRPEKALTLAEGEDATKLDAAASIELAIVKSGAYRDLSRLEEALEALRSHNVGDAPEPYLARYFYALAEAYLDLGKRVSAVRWFRVAASHDEYGLLNAEERANEIGDSSGPEKKG